MNNKFIYIFLAIGLYSCGLFGQGENQSRFGIHIDLSPSSIKFAKDMDVSWLHLNGTDITLWKTIEPENGNFILDDSIVDFLKSQEFHLVGSLFLTPGWASSQPHANFYPYKNKIFGPFVCLPADITDWMDYVKFILNRWDKYIDVWEIWNEPDIHFLVADSNGKINNYDKLVRSAINASNRLGNKDIFAGPALAYYLMKDQYKSPGEFPLTNYKRYRDTTFAENYFLNESQLPFDIFTFHQYSTPARPLPPRAIIISKINDIYQHIPSIKSVWVTEYNYLDKFSWEDISKQEEIGRHIVRDHLSLFSSGVEKVFLYSAINKPFGADIYSNLINDGVRTRITDIYSVMTHIINKTNIEIPVNTIEHKGWVEYKFCNNDGSVLVVPVAESGVVIFHLTEDARIISFDGKITVKKKGEQFDISEGDYYYIKYSSK